MNWFNEILKELEKANDISMGKSSDILKGGNFENSWRFSVSNKLFKLQDDLLKDYIKYSEERIKLEL